MDIIAFGVVGAFGVGIIVTIASHCLMKLFKKHVLKIVDPPRSFVMEKKVKCKSGEQRIHLHSVSSASRFQVTT